MKNNNEKFEKFIRDFDTIRMTQDEKNKIRKNLEAFTDSYISVRSPYQIYSSLFQRGLAFAVIAVLLVSSTKPASAGSLPGEMMYPIKIIHEKIESASISKPEKKISFEIKRAEIRIQEAVKLADSEKLDSKKQEKLANDIKKNVADVSEKIKKIQETDPEMALTLNSDLKTTLKVNSQALKDITKKKTAEVVDNSEKINKLEGSVDTLIKTENLDSKILADVLDVNAQKIVSETETTQKIYEEKNLIIQSSEKIVEEIVDESFADFIINSIAEDIKKTEVETSSIEDTISQSKDIKSIVVEPVQLKPVEILPKEANQVDILIADTQTIPAIPLEKSNPISEVAKTITNLVNPSSPSLEIAVIPPEKLLTENIAQQTEPAIIGTTPIGEEIFENIKTEIVSLENILLAQEKLRNLYTELNIIRNIENAPKIKLLIEAKQFGQAYIQLQKEIGVLSEIKLTKSVEIKLNVDKKTQE